MLLFRLYDDLDFIMIVSCC